MGNSHRPQAFQYKQMRKRGWPTVWSDGGQEVELGLLTIRIDRKMIPENRATGQRLEGWTVTKRRARGKEEGG